MTNTRKLWDSESRSRYAAVYARKGETIDQIANRAKYAECLIDHSITYSFGLGDTEDNILHLDFYVGWDADKALKTAWEVHQVTGFTVIFDFNGVQVQIGVKP
jgi:hypothetical protein